MSQSNIFNEIRNQLINNELFGNEKKLQFRNEYPEGCIVWLCKNQKAFKVTGMKKFIHNSEKVYEISYEAVNTACDFLDVAYESAKYKRERAIRKGYTLNESPRTKSLKINDMFRAELDCPNWSNKADETGYKQCPYNDKEFEHLDKEDDCCFEIYLQQIGYDNYQDFIKKNEFSTKEYMEIFEENYKEFLNNLHAKDYEENYVY